MAKRNPRQITIAFPQRGGARRGTGREPNGPQPGVRHVRRGSLGGAIPTLITMKILSGVANLRTRRRARAVLESLRRACARFETRITEFSIQQDHVHLIVETANERTLARAMKGLAVRIARAVNRSLERRGTVFADRFHHRALRTPRQVRNALAYVLCNARKHRVAPAARGWLDPLSSAPSFDGWVDAAELAERAYSAAPRTWLLRIGWRRAGLLDPAHVPGALS
jgi:REP element-mobilizing transposase RayT